MKSPFTGGNVVLHSEKRTAVFRKEKFEYTFLSYQCVDTRELFTTTELDTANTMQIYNQYRTKYGIPFPDEIGDYHLEMKGISNQRYNQPNNF